ncbi:MAG: PAS domain-containing protein [Alphaproteobacteria bacterium]|nr:PAS domain-containing protein [Alphaproteobacteria bacterium]
MQKQSTRDLFTYWNELRGTRSAPERRDIDPVRIRGALANTFILEADDDNGFTFRLAGSHLCSAYCRELKSRSFVGLWSEKDQDAIETLIKAVTEDHAVALINFSATAYHGAQLGFETILLPLKHNGATNTRIIGALTALTEPYWLGTHPVMEQRISGLRLIWPDDHTAALPGRDLSTAIDDRLEVGANGDAAPITAFGPAPGSRRYAHLSVIDGGKQ